MATNISDILTVYRVKADTDRTSSKRRVNQPIGLVVHYNIHSLKPMCIICFFSLGRMGPVCLCNARHKITFIYTFNPPMYIPCINVRASELYSIRFFPSAIDSFIHSIDSKFIRFFVFIDQSSSLQCNQPINKNPE